MSQTKVIYNSLSPPDGWRVPGAELELQTLIIFKLKLGVLCRARTDTAAAQASHRHDSGKLCRACSASFTKHEGGLGGVRRDIMQKYQCSRDNLFSPYLEDKIQPSVGERRAVPSQFSDKTRLHGTALGALCEMKGSSWIGWSHASDLGNETYCK